MLEQIALAEVPWFKDRTAPPPFSLTTKIRSNSPNAPPFRTIACFPWSSDSLHTLWNGNLYTSESLTRWKQTISDFSDAVAVGSLHKAYIFFTRRRKDPICVSLPLDETDLKALPTDAVNVAWTLDPNSPFEPLLIFSHLNLLYIYNVNRKGICSYLRGHGGAITAIAVHPITVNLFCTTSRDYSTRIYDLTLPPQDRPSNPHWPPGTTSSRAGAPHGLHMTEAEGSGNGRCIIILMGGRSGGHQAAVLGAAFHPQLPIIATCGLDRAVKIWFVPQASKVLLTREDKPLFSSSRIHKARVLSVSWLYHDLLLTHSAPSLMREPLDNREPKAAYLEPGQLIVWRWLAIDRFFPPGSGDETRQNVLRGCASDYQESASFKMISTFSFPRTATQYITPNLHVFQSAIHDPVVLFVYPDSTLISILNIIHLQPRKPPPFPLDPEGESLAETTKRMHLGEQRGSAEVEDSRWEVKTVSSNASVQTDNVRETLMACAMGMGGQIIVAVGASGSLWIWSKRHEAVSD